MKFEAIRQDGAIPVYADRSMRGSVAWSSGRFAEESVARSYISTGHDVMAERWRGKGGEIDLILHKNGAYVFVEVKKARCHQQAAARISRRQMSRICNSALEYCDRLPGGSLTPMRFDAALVDDLGRVEIIENAFGAD